MTLSLLKISKSTFPDEVHMKRLRLGAELRLVLAMTVILFAYVIFRQWCATFASMSSQNQLSSFWQARVMTVVFGRIGVEIAFLLTIPLLLCILYASGRVRLRFVAILSFAFFFFVFSAPTFVVGFRSDERRVGKECSD